jgi:type I restriction enzyme S subunit
LFYYLHHFHTSGRTEPLQAQTTNIRNLRFNEYLAILIPLPPLAEQRRIVAELEAVWARVNALKEAQAETDSELQRLERAILDKAFRGEL